MNKRLRFLQVQNLPSLESTVKRLWAIKEEWIFQSLTCFPLWRRVWINTAPWHMPHWLLNLKLERFSILQKLKLYLIYPLPVVNKAKAIEYDVRFSQTRW